MSADFEAQIREIDKAIEETDFDRTTFGQAKSDILPHVSLSGEKEDSNKSEVALPGSSIGPIQAGPMSLESKSTTAFMLGPGGQINQMANSKGRTVLEPRKTHAAFCQG